MRQLLNGGLGWLRLGELSTFRLSVPQVSR